MKHEKVEKAKQEIKRLMAAMNELQTAAQNASDRRNGYYYGYPRLTGAVRRASMDVTRALSDLRRPD